MPLNTAQRTVIANRRQLVARLRLRGMTQRDIVESLNKQAEKTGGEQWSLGTVNGDIRAIEKEWKAQAQRDMGEHKARVLAELDEVLREAWQAKDMKHVLSCLSQIRALLGLDAPEKIDANVSAGGKLTIHVIGGIQEEDI